MVDADLSPDQPTTPILISGDDQYDWYIYFDTQTGWTDGTTVTLDIRPGYVPKANYDPDKDYSYDSTSRYSALNRGGKNGFWTHTYESLSEWTNVGGTITGNGQTRYFWKIPIGSIIDEGTASKNNSVLDFFYESSVKEYGPSVYHEDLRYIFKYSYRYTDTLKFNIQLTIHRGAIGIDGTDYTGQWVQEFHFVPTYTLESHSTYGPWVHYTQDGSLWIPYTANDWTRPNDRFNVEKAIVTDSGKVLVSAGVYGIVDQYGRIKIESKDLNRIPATGERIQSGLIRFNASYRTKNMQFATMDLSGAYVYSDSMCNTPVIDSATIIDGTVVLTYHDLQDKSSPIVNYEVRLDDADYVEGVDRYYGTSTRAILYDQPWNKELTYKVVGYNATGYPSQPATINVGPIVMSAETGTYRFRSVDDSSKWLDIQYNVEESVSVEAIYETVKFAGRRYESIGYGYGQKRDLDISGVLVLDNSSIFNNSNDIVTVSDIEADIYDVLLGHTCIMRTPEGKRLLVGVTSVDVQVPRTMLDVASVSIRGKVVS